MRFIIYLFIYLFIRKLRGGRWQKKVGLEFKGIYFMTKEVKRESKLSNWLSELKIFILKNN